MVSSWQVGSLALAAIALAACGGGGGGGNQPVAVSGTVALQAAGTSAGSGAGAGDTIQVRATASSGGMHVTTTDGAGHFTMTLPADDWYVMGFEHRDGVNGQMHSAGHMVFACGNGETDRFFLSNGESALDLGTVAVRLDGSFAVPAHNPLDPLGGMGNGHMNMSCVDVGDANHDGFYDDDMDHDGYHEDDMDHDGFHDCAMGHMGGGGGSCGGMGH